jgi:hypothetical protein
MRTISRFETTSPSLVDAYRQASRNQRRRAALGMCLFALEQAGLRCREIDDALALLRRDVSGSSDMRQKLDRLTEELDEQYFRLSDNTENITPEAFVMFQKARAAAALAFALSPHGEQLHEAIYEAISASSHPDEATQTAEAMLRAK